MFRAFVAGALAGSLILPTVPAAATTSETERVTARNKVYAGMYSSRWEAAADLEAMASWTGRRVTFAGTFHDVTESDPPAWEKNTAWLLEQAWQAQATPFANVMIEASAASIARGEHDEAIRRWAGHVQGWLGRGGRRSLLIAPLQEMNGDWVPYGMNPAGYREAYRRFRQIFVDMGMDETQVRWVFAPNGWSVPPYRIADYYPGDDVVDVIGVSTFNFGSCLQHWWDAVDILAGTVHELRQTVTASKPYLLAQVGSSTCGGDKDRWLRDLFAFAAADFNVVGLVYFNFFKEADWQVWDGRVADTGWRDALLAPTTRYQWPLTEWFQPGPLPFAPYVPPFWDDDGLVQESDIAALRELGLVKGCATDRFCPSEPVTREQAALVLARAMGAPLDEAVGNRFVDVPARGGAAAAIDHLAELGIVVGCGDGHFCPDRHMTRAELAALMHNARLRAPLRPAEGLFADVPASSWYAPYVEALASEGIVHGFPDGTYRPAQPASRGELATFLAGTFLRPEPPPSPPDGVF